MVLEGNVIALKVQHARMTRATELYPACRLHIKVELSRHRRARESYPAARGKRSTNEGTALAERHEAVPVSRRAGEWARQPD